MVLFFVFVFDSHVVYGTFSSHSIAFKVFIVRCHLVNHASIWKEFDDTVSGGLNYLVVTTREEDYTREFHHTIVECCDGFHIQVVSRFVKHKNVRCLNHHAGEKYILPFGTEYKTVIVFACVLLAYFGNYLVTSVIYKWGMSFVDTRKRASFGAGKEMVSLISGMVFVLVMGFVIDKFAADGNVEGGFVFIGIAILFFSILDLISLLVMKNQKIEKSESADEPIFSVMKKLFCNKGFICLLIANVLWSVAVYMTNGFMGIYKTSPTELAFTVGEVQMINIFGCLCRFAVSKPFGRFSDKTSYATGILLGTQSFR